jgi:hypothetical protein
LSKSPAGTANGFLFGRDLIRKFVSYGFDPQVIATPTLFATVESLRGAVRAS